MTLCLLPPVSVLTEQLHSDKQRRDQRPLKRARAVSIPFSAIPNIDGDGQSMTSSNSTTSLAAPKREQRLPGFKELLQSIEDPGGLNSLQVTPKSPSPQYTSSLQPSRPTHSRSLSSRKLFHPYSPPAAYRSVQIASPSRTPSPGSDRSSYTDSIGQQTRSARPTYTEEEIYFIWYHRDDLGMGWQHVLEKFNEHFRKGRRNRNGVQGIQCRYYRALEIHRVPKSRDRNRSLPGQAYGVRERAPEKWWPWMSLKTSNASERK